MLPEPPPHPRRIVYLGSPELSVAPLEALLAAGYEVPLVVSRPDKRRGRRGRPEPSPVKAAALGRGLAVSDRTADAVDAGADLGVVVAFGQLIRLPVLEALPLVNLHFSLLPRWRGAAPVERAVLAGDERTGVCLMALEEELDTGGVYRRAETAIDPDESVDELRTRLVELGIGLLLDALATGFGPAAPQLGEPTYAAKLAPAELALDWARPAAELSRIVRVGRAWTTVDGRRLLVWRAAPVPAADAPGADPGAGAASGPGSVSGTLVRTGEGWLRLDEVQPEGRARMTATTWLRGVRPAGELRLGT